MLDEIAASFVPGIAGEKAEELCGRTKEKAASFRKTKPLFRLII